MSLLIVGSVAIDSIETPWGKVDQVLGGSATYAALAARLWTPTSMVAVVGSDFPRAYAQMLAGRGLNGSGLQRARGKTFRWKGRYDADLQAHTLHLDLGVFKSFQPELTPEQRRSSHAFLGNIHPELQWRVLRQLSAPKLTACDSRDDWIRHNRKEFVSLLKRMDLVFLNDSEARLLTGVHGLVQATRHLARMGPKVAVVKKGEHGVLAASKDSFFSLPGFPLAQVVDPTGAGDAFAGTCMGYLATQRQSSWANLCRAVQYASVAAAMTIEDFGPARLAAMSKRDVLERAQAFQSLTRPAVL
ncbi:MAG: sugar kinase [Candidatus Omnitrophica bacterium]|nr:sugar kinase [Candidatus Omnitrophota bacterium]